MTHVADNPMTGSDFDWMVSNHAVWGWKALVKASVSGVSLLQLTVHRNVRDWRCKNVKTFVRPCYKINTCVHMHCSLRLADFVAVLVRTTFLNF